MTFEGHSLSHQYISIRLEDWLVVCHQEAWTLTEPLTTTAVVRPSVVCRLSVTFVHPTQASEIFGNVSTLFNTLAICWHPGKISQRSSLWNPSVGG